MWHRKHKYRSNETDKEFFLKVCDATDRIIETQLFYSSDEYRLSDSMKLFINEIRTILHLGSFPTAQIFEAAATSAATV